MLASLGGLVSCAAKVHFEVAGNAMNELIVNHDFDFRQLVTAAEGQPVTDTFQIAKAFGKRHADVLRALKIVIALRISGARIFALPKKSMT